MHVRVLIEFHDIVRRNCGRSISAMAGIARSWKSCHTSSCSMYGFIPGNGEGTGDSLDCFSILHEELRTDT